MEVNYLNEIKAIEGWALQCYQESVKKSPNVDVILENLRKINLQARKLERGSKGEASKIKMLVFGIAMSRRGAENHKDVDKAVLMDISNLERDTRGLEGLGEDLVKKITQLRAAVLTLRDIKKDKGLSNSSKRNIRMLSSLTTEAIKLYESINGRYEWVLMKYEQLKESGRLRE